MIGIHGGGGVDDGGRLNDWCRWWWWCLKENDKTSLNVTFRTRPRPYTLWDFLPLWARRCKRFWRRDDLVPESSTKLKICFFSLTFKSQDCWTTCVIKKNFANTISLDIKFLPMPLSINILHCLAIMKLFLMYHLKDLRKNNGIIWNKYMSVWYWLD